MAHMLDFSKGKAACMVVGEPAWHKLGVVIPKAATSDEAIVLSGQDLIVEKWPLMACGPTGPSQPFAPVPKRYATVRTDTNAVLGVVSDQYKVFQNREAFNFMDGLVGEKLAMYETAGVLNEGRRVWIMARIPGAYKITGTDDVTLPYALLTNTHDGSGLVDVFPTGVRTVCANTLNLALSRKHGLGIRISHRQNLDDRLAQAKEALGLVTDRFKRFDVESEAMARRQLTEKELTIYMTDLFPIKVAPPPAEGLLDKIIDQHTQREETGKALLDAHYAKTEAEVARNAGILTVILDNYETEMPGVQGSAWAAYNAVSKWTDHQMSAHGKDDRTRLERRLDSNWFGKSADMKAVAYDRALALVG